MPRYNDDLAAVACAMRHDDREEKDDRDISRANATHISGRCVDETVDNNGEDDGTEFVEHARPVLNEQHVLVLIEHTLSNA